MSEALVAEIQAALGPRGWLDPADAGSALTGWRGTYSGTPVLVARPDTVGGVQEVVRTCARHGAAVVTQGGNTGLSGGSVPIDDLSDGRPSVLLLTTRLNRITSVDPARVTVTAEAGCTIEQVQQAAVAVDRQLTRDWGARGSATVGGAISTNAGGLNVLRYGNTRRHVLGLEAVLADGRVFDGLRALRKDNTGYDLKHLFIGAEGTLGVVTRAVLELQPAMPHHRSLFASLTGLDVVTALYGLARSLDPGGLRAVALVPAMGGGAAVQSSLLPALFGVGHIGSISGTLALISVLASALGALTFSLGSIVFGGYRSASLWFTVLPLAVALLAFVYRRHFAMETTSGRNHRTAGPPRPRN